MDTFNTSNGNQVRMRETGVLGVSVAKNSLHDWCVGSDGVVDLREFFQAERDTELGRWRWPDDPRYLVFPLKDDDEVRVLDENSGQSAAIRRSSFRSGLTHTHFVGAALAYFDTRPEPKPWHDAKPGELWEVSVSPAAMENIPPREPLPMQVMLDDSGELETLFFAHWNGPDVETIDIEDRHIESATLLWSATK